MSHPCIFNVLFDTGPAQRVDWTEAGCESDVSVSGCSTYNNGSPEQYRDGFRWETIFVSLRPPRGTFYFLEVCLSWHMNSQLCFLKESAYVMDNKAQIIWFWENSIKKRPSIAGFDVLANLSRVWDIIKIPSETLEGADVRFIGVFFSRDTSEKQETLTKNNLLLLLCRRETLLQWQISPISLVLSSIVCFY